MFNQKKLFSINKISVIDTNFLSLYSIISFLLLLHFVVSYDIIQTAEGQVNMDSFTARGIIFTQLSQSPLLNEQNITNNNNTQQQQQNLTTLLNNTSSNSIQQDTGKSIPSLEGQWAMEVRKGELDFFRVMFALVQNQKMVNAFGIFNLKDTKYIQLNDKGTELISGTVDFTSVGLKNETIPNVEATITITGLTQIRIALDTTTTGKYFTDPIFGSTRFLADGSGNIIIQPRPAAPPSQSSPPPTVPLPQTNSFTDSKLF